MPSLRACAALLLLGTLAACGSDKADNPPAPPPPSPIIAHSTIIDSSGQQVGTADLSEPASHRTSSPEFASTSRLNSGPGVSIHVQLSNLAPGDHEIVIAAAGRCDAPRFTSAGPHFNPFARKHGTRSPDGPHAGDLGNITLGPDGTGQLQVTDPLVTLVQDSNNSLLLPTGTSLLVYAGPDDQVSDPEGGAGARIACGVIVSSKPTPAPSFTSSPHSPLPRSSPSPTTSPSASA